MCTILKVTSGVRIDYAKYGNLEVLPMIGLRTTRSSTGVGGSDGS